MTQGGSLRTSGTCKLAEQYLTLSKAAMAILSDLLRNGPYVFSWPDGRTLTVDYVTHAFHKAVAAAGILDLRQHDLRHAYAIRRLRGGANLVAVSALLRHASTRMTERYLHVTRADLREAVEAALAFGFDTMALSAVCAIPERANTRSIRLLEGLGFEVRPDLDDPDQPSCTTYVLSRS